MRFVLQSSALAALLAMAGAGQATVIELENADFESGRLLVEGDVAPQHIFINPGWGASGGSGTGRWNPAGAFRTGETAHGVVGYASGGGVVAQPNPGMLGQTVANEVLRANTRYVLTVDIGKRAGSSASWGYEIGFVSNLGGAGAFVLGKQTGRFDNRDAVFETISYAFETGASGAGLNKSFAIALSSSSSPFGDVAAFDNVRLESFSLATVPEPANWALMIIGFAGAGAAARRRHPRAVRLA